MFTGDNQCADCPWLTRGPYCVQLGSSCKMNQEAVMSGNGFAFELSDIKSWIIKRKDGTTLRYNVLQKGQDASIVRPGASSASVTSKKNNNYNFWNTGKTSYSAWCSHTPDTANAPIFTDGKINLYIADSQGARKASDLFDVCVDGGGVLSVPGEYDLPSLFGDPKFSRALASHVWKDTSKEIKKDGPRIIKIRWADRCAPPVYPSFWPALNEELHKAQAKMNRPLNVLTICQGGHGRSGSALVALMMCMTDYTPLDALTHIRALHCARAIESKDQHAYLNLVAEELGREPNALEAETVKSFKDRFLTLDSQTAEPYKERVRGGKGAIVAEREGSYL